MNTAKPQWTLVGTHIDERGEKHFTFICRNLRTGSTEDGCFERNEDYDELLRVLNMHFDVAEEGNILGPDIELRYLRADRLRFGVVLADPDSLRLFSRNARDHRAMDAFIEKLLPLLNQED